MTTARLSRHALALAAFVAAMAVACGAEPSWPEFHGPKRDNISTETGLLKEWPADGPTLLWKYSECGLGYSGVSIAEGLIFTTGDFGDEEMLVAVDLNGKLKWRATNGAAWKGAQPGARTTPTYSDGLVYQLNAKGRLAAFRAATGEAVWTVDFVQRFGAIPGGWGFTENVIIDGDKLLCMPGGQTGRVAALDKKTGATVWANKDFKDRAAYSSPIIATHNGVRQFIGLSHETVVGIEVATGKLLWTHKHPSTCDQNVTSPIFHDGSVFVTSGHKGGGRVVKLAPDSLSVAESWFGTDMDNCHGGVIYLDGYLYGSGCRLYKRGLVCADFATGKTMFNAQEVGKVSVTYADGLLYCLGNDCTMALVKVTPQQAMIVSRFTPPWKEKPPCLSHPVVCGGRLYIRHLDDLFVYDISAKK